MKRLKIFSCLFVLQVLLVIPALMLVAETPVSPGVKTGDRENDSKVESIINQVRDYRKAGKFEEALKLLNIALKKFPQKEYWEKLQIERAKLHFWWAVSLKKKYDYASSIKHFELAYAINKIYRPKFAAVNLNNIGFLYDALGQKQKALEFYQEALPIFQAVGDRAGEAATLNNIGRVYSLGQKQKALEFYQKALPIRKEVGDRAGEAVTLYNIGLVYYALGQQRKALEFYQESLPIRKEVGNRAGEAKTLNNLMSCRESLNNTQFSIFYGKQSVNAYQNLRANISELDRESKKSYLEKAKETYRFLTRLLIAEGRLSEAQHVSDMLKEKEYFEFTHKEGFSTTSTYSQLDFTRFENQWLKKYKKVTKDYSAISGDYYLLKKKKLKSDAEKKRMKALEASLEKYQKDYNQYLAELKKAFDKYNKTIKKGQ